MEMNYTTSSSLFPYYSSSINTGEVDPHPYPPPPPPQHHHLLHHALTAGLTTTTTTMMMKPLLPDDQGGTPTPHGGSVVDDDDEYLYDDEGGRDEIKDKFDGGGGGEGNSTSTSRGGLSGGVGKKVINKAAGEKKAKKPKYAFQTRSQVDILDDGYRWRKYGQKAVKNNKFPRSYYRCTYQGCNVKKQVQRLTKDEGVVVTTYEGMHSHPIEKSTDNFEHILNQMHIYASF